MPGYMLHHHQTGHPVMGEIGPRRIVVFIGQEPKLYFYDASFLRKIGLLRKESVLRTEQEGVSKRCILLFV